MHKYDGQIHSPLFILKSIKQHKESKRRAQASLEGTDKWNRRHQSIRKGKPGQHNGLCYNSLT